MPLSGAYRAHALTTELYERTMRCGQWPRQPSDHKDPVIAR